MTGTRDVTMSSVIVYGKHFRTHLSQIISRFPVPGHALLKNGIRYRVSDFTVA